MKCKKCRKTIITTESVRTFDRMTLNGRTIYFHFCQECFNKKRDQDYKDIKTIPAITKRKFDFSWVKDELIGELDNHSLGSSEEIIIFINEFKQYVNSLNADNFK